MIADAFRRLVRRLRPSSQDAARRTRQDQLIARRLRDTFEEDLAAADVRGLHFYVQDGTVTIFGTVRHDLDRDLLRALAAEAPGVQGVELNLRVAAAEEPSAEAASDASS